MRRAWAGLGVVLLLFMVAHGLPEYYPDHFTASEAIWSGDIDRLRLLLDRGLDPDTRAQWRSQIRRLFENRTPGQGSMFRLVHEPADRSLLHVALSSQRTDMARLLIERGADVNARNPRLETPLFNASVVADSALVAVLLERGADPLAEDIEGGTALREGPGRNFRMRLTDPRIIQLLEEAEARARR